MTNTDAIKWLKNLSNDLGAPQHACLWHYEQAIDEICKLLEEREEFNIMKNNHVHLCNSCCQSYPQCSDDEHAIEFGDGTGDDNICCCNKYEPLLEHDYERGGCK